MSRDPELRDRLSELVHDFAGGVYSRFAELIGVSSVSMMGYLQGKNLPGFAVLARIVDACGVSPNWLIKGWPPKYATQNRPQPASVRVVDVGGAGDLTDDDYVTAPILDLSAFRDLARGVLLVGPDTASGYLVVRHRPGARLVAVRQLDDALAPDVAAGDVCVVDLEQTDIASLDGAAVLADAGGLISARRLAGGMIVSNNPRAFPPQRATRRAILGRVLEVRRDAE
ncbi:helix-turn-helix transcriptional regulator [bacterium]|nr:helix-turn-helix transcriptional regulator [bacterium]